MPIVSTRIVGPSVQADGSHRGRLLFTFDTGHEERVGIRAKDRAAWDLLLAALPDEVAERVAQRDAEQAAANGNDVAAVKQASVKRVFLAHLRQAFEEGESYKAYRKFLKINNYRNAQGWTVQQIFVNLQAEGLTVEEWAKIKARFQYLFNAARITAMEDYITVRNGDPR